PPKGPQGRPGRGSRGAGRCRIALSVFFSAFCSPGVFETCPAVVEPSTGPCRSSESPSSTWTPPDDGTACEQSSAAELSTENRRTPDGTAPAYQRGCPLAAADVALHCLAMFGDGENERGNVFTPTHRAILATLLVLAA